MALTVSLVLSGIALAAAKRAGMAGAGSKSTGAEDAYPPKITDSYGIAFPEHTTAQQILTELDCYPCAAGPGLSYKVDCGGLGDFCLADVYGQIEAYALKPGGRSTIVSALDPGTDSLHDRVAVGAGTTGFKLPLADEDMRRLLATFDGRSCITGSLLTDAGGGIEWPDFQAELVFKEWGHIQRWPGADGFDVSSGGSIVNLNCYS
ncbi:hypothetical protein AYO39_02430 [Actinobacteria bacterium SCGC AG-212-D09]|nr:hypothetical protein AYO39_02430 [Actinobacteria bacterium SCGC AG-212-D09]